MATPTEMRALATTLEEIAPHVETDYGPGQVATYGLAWEALRSAADEIERLTQDYCQVVDKFDDCRAALARRVEKDTGKIPHPPDDDSRDWHTWLIEESDKAIDQSSPIAPGA